MKEDIWYILSDFFVDNEVNYEYMASRLKKYPTDEVEFCFFNEVAPALGSIFFTPVPYEWVGYSKEEVVNRIQKSRENKLKNKLLTRFYRSFLKDEWAELKKSITRFKLDN